MGASACKQAVIRCQASRGQQHVIGVEWIRLLPWGDLILYRTHQVSVPVEGRGGEATRPGAEQSQRGVIQSRLHRAGGGAVRWVCRDKILSNKVQNGVLHMIKWARKKANSAKPNSKDE